MRHLTSLFDLTSDETREILDLASAIKQETKTGIRTSHCANRTLTLIFEKPSLRTRVSFEAGMHQLGGMSLFLSGKDAGLEGRESVEDIAQVVGRFTDVVVLRTFSQQLIETFSAHAGCPVINGLSDEFHPCQALTDVMTVEEQLGTAVGKKIVYIGDGNNVARSLVLACGHVGAAMTIAAPDGYLLDEDFVSRIQAQFPALEFQQTNDAQAAVDQAHVIYTDVWASMGQEAEKEKRAREFSDFQITTDLLDAAADDVRFMHCLPARRGLEVTAEVMDDPRCVVFDQAENRMHLTKGLIVWLLRHAGEIE